MNLGFCLLLHKCEFLLSYVQSINFVVLSMAAVMGCLSKNAGFLSNTAPVLCNLLVWNCSEVFRMLAVIITK